MDDDTRYSIGDLARRTGLSVRTIRFYSDTGCCRRLTVALLGTAGTAWRRWRVWT
jgi:hypothetical protein